MTYYCIACGRRCDWLDLMPDHTCTPCYMALEADLEKE